MTTVANQPVIEKVTSISAFPKMLAKHSEFAFKKATGEFVGNVADIHLTLDWNIRNIDREQVEGIKNALEQGQSIDPIEVELITVDGVPKMSIVDGHHTTVAINEMVSDGKHDGYHKMSVFKGSELDKLTRCYNATQNLELSPLDAAKAFQRMKVEGATNKEIQRRTGKSLSFISNALYLLNAPAELQDMMKEKTIACSRVGRLMREHGFDNALLIAKAEVEAYKVSKQNENVETQAPVTQSEETQLTITGESNAAIEDAEYTELEAEPSANDVKIIRKEPAKKATKNALKTKSLSSGKVQEMIELMRLLGRKEVSEDGALQLNKVEKDTFERLVQALNEVDTHNQRVAEEMQNLGVAG